MSHQPAYEFAFLYKPERCGSLSKHLRINPNGEIETVDPGGAMWTGTMQRLFLPTFADLADVLKGCSSYNAIALGALAPDLALDGNGSIELVTVKELNRRTGGTGYTMRQTFAARTKQSLLFREGAPGVMLVDYDSKGLPSDVGARIEAAGGVWNALVQACPALDGIERIQRSSTSAGLFDERSGKMFPGSGGLHIYLPVVDAADIPRALRVLFARAWLAGYGWIRISKAGSLLTRGIVDDSVGSPERIVFEGAPRLDPPLKQDGVARVPLHTPCAILDTRKALPDLSVKEQARYDALVAEAKRKLRPESDKVQKRVIREKATGIAAKTGKPVSEIEHRLSKRYAGVLMPECELVFDNPDIGTVSVRDVLRDPERYVGETLSDPLEGLSYGRSKAMVMKRDDGSDRLFIHSFAHGGLIYDLRFDADLVRDILDSTDRALLARIFARIVIAAELAPDERQQIRDDVVRRSGLGKRTVNDMVKENEVRFREQRRANAPHDGENRDELDTRPVIRQPPPDADYTRFVTSLDATMSEIVSPIPPMRDVDGNLIRIATLAPEGTHLLSGSGNDREVSVPPTPLIKRLEDVDIALEVEKWVKVESPKHLREVRLKPDMCNALNALAERSELPTCRAIQTLPLVFPPRLPGEQPTILAHNGLDRAHQLVMLIDEDLSELLPVKPTTLGDASKALNWLLSDWLKDVAASDEMKILIVAAALTILERALLVDERPGFIVTAGMRAVGKSTLINAISAAIFGYRAAASAWSEDVEERRKAVMAALFEGRPLLVWDNIVRGTQLSCPHIERAMTFPSVEDRLLGSTKIIRAAATTIFIWTGNMIAPKGDLASRVLVIELDAERPDPENRPMRPDFIGWTLKHRREILAALYAVLMLERPAAAIVEPTRFKRWYAAVGWPLERAGAWTGISFEKHFARNNAADDETVNAGYILCELRACFGDRWFTAAEVTDVLRPTTFGLGRLDRETDGVKKGAKTEEEIEHLIAAFNALGGKPFPQISSQISGLHVGHKLRILQGRVVAIEGEWLRLMSQMGERNILRWRVTKVTRPAGE